MSRIKDFIYRMRGYTTLETLRKQGLVFGENFNPQFPFFLDPSHCWLISIGDNVTFGPNVQVFAHDASTCKHIGYARIGRVEIGDNVFIGAGSIVLPGVSIGNNVIVGAGSVVSRDIPDNMVCCGNPASAISSVEVFVEKHRKLMDVAKVYGEEYTERGRITSERKIEQRSDLSNGTGYVI